MVVKEGIDNFRLWRFKSHTSTAESFVNVQVSGHFIPIFACVLDIMNFQSPITYMFSVSAIALILSQYCNYGVFK